MTLYRQKSFTVPTIERRSKVPCAVHHFVRGECMRCDEKIRTTEDPRGNLSPSPTPSPLREPLKGTHPNLKQTGIDG